MSTLGPCSPLLKATPWPPLMKSLVCPTSPPPPHPPPAKGLPPFDHSLLPTRPPAARIRWTQCQLSSPRMYYIWGEPERAHTSVTAFVEVVCMSVGLRPYTINFKWAHVNISWRLNVASCMRWRVQPAVRQWRASARAQHWREGSPRNEYNVNACMAAADHDRQGQAAHRQCKSRILWSPCIIDTHKREKFSS